jgi:YD repeat-containing protein
MRAGRLCCAGTGAVMLSTAGLAQGGDSPRSGTVAPPAEKMALTPAGVDMRSGRFNYSQTDVSIGEDNETGGVALTRTLNADAVGHLNPFGNFSTNWDIFVSTHGININEGQYHSETGPDTEIGIHFGSRSETFYQVGSEATFTQVSRGAYARLSADPNGGHPIYTFTTSDGTVAVFRALGQECANTRGCAFISTLTYADGTRFTFEYESPTPAAPNTTRLRAVASNRGYALLMQYGSGADWNHVTSACVLNLALQAKPSGNTCPASPQATASYTYTTFGASERRLASATDASNATWSFTYSAAGQGLSMGFIRPGEASAWLTNSIWLRPNNDGLVDEIVSAQTSADGATWHYSYATSPPVDGEIPQLAGGNYVDPAGSQTTFEYGFPIRPGAFNPPRVNQQGYPVVNYGDVFFQITPDPITITDPLQRVTRENFCDPTAEANLPMQETHRCMLTPTPISTTDPEGRVTELIWDYTTRNLLRATRHAVPGSVQPNGQPWPDIVESWTYDCQPTTMAICAKPLTHTDANHNVTTYTYASHGGLLTETGPAVSVIDDANAVTTVQPQTRNAYAQRSAWLSNGSGGYVQAATPIWLPVSTSICRTSNPTGNPAAPCATVGDEVLTQFDYGPNSGPNMLLLRGQTVTSTDNGTTTTLRTCFGYDARGRRISAMAPNANLASCP